MSFAEEADRANKVLRSWGFSELIALSMFGPHFTWCKHCGSTLLVGVEAPTGFKPVDQHVRYCPAVSIARRRANFLASEEFSDDGV